MFGCLFVAIFRVSHCLSFACRPIYQATFLPDTDFDAPLSDMTTHVIISLHLFRYKHLLEDFGICIKLSLAALVLLDLFLTASSRRLTHLCLLAVRKLLFLQRKRPRRFLSHRRNHTIVRLLKLVKRPVKLVEFGMECEERLQTRSWGFQ